LQAPGLPFSDVLSEKEIEEVFDEADCRFAQEEGEIFTPPLTLWAFLSQVLHKDNHGSCIASVSRIIVLMVALGREPCAKNNGGYCKARAKLPEVVIERLALRVADGCEKEVPTGWLGLGRHIKLVDGTTVSMPDTEENQEEYPQQASQEEGLGFPIARLVLLLSLATAMTCGMAIGPCAGKETGELALFRQLLDQLDSNDVILADRFFCSYFMIAMLMGRNVDIIARLHQARKKDAYRTKRLGKNDYLIQWMRPPRPEWMDQETYDQMPESLTLRQIDVSVSEPGFRVKSFTVVTTLNDETKYPAIDIADLYRKRWQAEVDIRAIKCNIGMDVLRCKSPEMVRKEIWTSLLAYNLIRRTILHAAIDAGLKPREISFTTAMQTMAASWVVNPTLSAPLAKSMITYQIASLAQQIVGKRPNRSEPRAVKRRPKPHRLLNMTRAAARELLRKGIDPYKRIR